MHYAQPLSADCVHLFAVSDAMHISIPCWCVQEYCLIWVLHANALVPYMCLACFSTQVHADSLVSHACLQAAGVLE